MLFWCHGFIFSYLLSHFQSFKSLWSEFTCLKGIPVSFFFFFWKWKLFGPTYSDCNLEPGQWAKWNRKNIYLKLNPSGLNLAQRKTLNILILSAFLCSFINTFNIWSSDQITWKKVTIETCLLGCSQCFRPSFCKRSWTIEPHGGEMLLIDCTRIFGNKLFCFHRWGCGAAAWTGRQRDADRSKAQQREHLAGAQRECSTPAQTGDEDQDEDQQGRRGETYSAQTGECVFCRKTLNVF